ncbi:putative iron hydrogenase [Hamiltosporidium tvaerminnensis]|uniref:Putative iron hydrogenase n=2 Tax=Hamiltosporidium TaxID=1176354 RepID=A0A4Q9M142_9MICR|nr:hypothetical protein LUQ84_000277 [Hamiltosporidium tvaerminnensis]TBU04577.1 putative iron hydrogenase [Hamiltosporidium tvaerminnensis]TBU07034.1 putative iron hydrogenase [Hamiltosporidium magnivora]TBU20369.1 putative iron hydrogenase [Hamiltosporidium tvaerminnensis]
MSFNFDKKILNNSKTCVKLDKEIEISLDDCISCSGCLSSTDEAFGSTYSLNLLLDDFPKDIAIIISSVSKTNLYILYKKYFGTFTDFERALINFIRITFQPQKIYDLSYFQETQLCMAYKEFINRKNMLISSFCPGSTLYIEKKAPELLENLSKVFTLQQMSYLHNKALNTTTLSIVHCYDKKLENNRDNIKIEHIISTKEFIKILRHYKFDDYILDDSNNKNDEIQKNEISYKMYEGTVYSFIDYFISKINPTKTSENIINKEFIEYFIEKEEIKYKFLKIYRLNNIVNFLNKYKNAKSTYDYVEMYACVGSCSGGSVLEDGEMDIRMINNEFEFLTEKVLHNSMDLLLFSGKREFTAFKKKNYNFIVEW